MEDILQIALTIGIVIFALISSIRKRDRQAMQEAAEGEPQLPEGWPTGLPLEPMGEKVSPTPQKRIKQRPQRLHPDSQELLMPETARSVPPKRRPSRQNAPTEQQEHATKQPEGKRSSTSERHPLTADFDAKKAVVWAEILKPKFEEE